MGGVGDGNRENRPLGLWQYGWRSGVRGFHRTRHAFSRRVDPTTLQRVESPDQIDSWNRTWTFFEWNLRPRSLFRVDNEEWKKDPRVASPRGPVPPQ